MIIYSSIGQRSGLNEKSFSRIDVLGGLFCTLEVCVAELQITCGLNSSPHFHLFKDSLDS